MSMGKADVHSIPQELVDIIIDYLHSDQDALCTCALVCKNWIPSSRFHLSVKTGHFNLMPHSYVEFLRLLDAPSCTLVPFLRHLVIQDDRDHSSCFQAREVSQLLRQLPALHSIYVQLRRCDKTWHEAPGLFSGFTKITDVSIGATYFDGVNYFLDFACSFPSLKSLHLLELGYDDDQVLSTSIPIPGTLRILHMETYAYKPALNWLMSSGKMPALDTIRMIGAAWDELPCIGDFLGVLGDTLLHLELDFWAEEMLVDGRSQRHPLFPCVHPRVHRLHR
jgi:hypothetical protein